MRLSGQSSWVNSSQLDSSGNRETAALEVPPCADAVVGDGARVARCHGAEGEALLPREIGVPAMWRSTRSPSWTPPEDEDLLDIVVGCTARAGIATLATNRAPPRQQRGAPVVSWTSEGAPAVRYRTAVVVSPTRHEVILVSLYARCPAGTGRP